MVIVMVMTDEQGMVDGEMMEMRGRAMVFWWCYVADDSSPHIPTTCLFFFFFMLANVLANFNLIFISRL